MKYIITLFFISLHVAASEYYEMYGNEYYQELDANARAVNLKQLRSSDKNELRLWWREPMYGDINAIIIREKSIYECEAKSKYSEINTEIIVKPGACKTARYHLESKKLEEYLLVLTDLESKDMNCKNVMDGWGITVEGVINQKRFAFRSWNPDACENPDAEKLLNILKAIEKLKT